jgi:hypothetical protein
MNEILVVASIVLVVLLTFASGFFMGLGFREKPLLPVEPAVPDKIKQLEYEADQKALAECLNYSIDVAYKLGNRA